MIHCKDPTFVGTAIYTGVGFETMKLSRLKRAVTRTDGTVDIYTQNSHYCAEFSNDATRRHFVTICSHLGRLELC